MPQGVLREEFERALESTNLMDSDFELRALIALERSILLKLTTSDWMEQVQQTFDRFEQLLAEPPAKSMEQQQRQRAAKQQAFSQHRQAIEGGRSEQTLRNEFLKVQRRLEETRASVHKRLMDEGAMIRSDTALALLNALVTVVILKVKDPDALDAVSTEYRRLVGQRGLAAVPNASEPAA
jgi:ribonucleotide reductase alpha subunit